jgi:pimeloyl-ACP methyl ester carboxylesterase
MGQLTHIVVGDQSFRARVANLDGKGEAIILLHGFPQTSAAWQPLLDAASARGHRVIAFDQRGYSPGARPQGVSAYTKDHLLDDVIGVADAVGFDRFHLVGHDWGSAIGWSVLMAHPERVISWSSLSIAHPYAFEEAVRTDPDQRKRSRYIAFFRLPWLPELVLGFNRLKIFRSMMYHCMPRAHVEEYLRVLGESGALKGALNYYRALGKSRAPPTGPNVDRPVLFIWGNRDPSAGRKAVDAQAQYIKGPYTKLELDAGHWLLETRTDIVVESILEHIESAT